MIPSFRLCFYAKVHRAPVVACEEEPQGSLIYFEKNIECIYLGTMGR